MKITSKNMENNIEDQAWDQFNKLEKPKVYYVIDSLYIPVSLLKNETFLYALKENRVRIDS